MRYFLDTEFNGMGGDLISLALVAEEEERYRYVYLATKCMRPNVWVAENVIPIIGIHGAWPTMIEPDQFGYCIKMFLADDSDPVVIADWPDDIKYFCQCLITGPGQMINIPSLKFELIRIESYPTTLPGAVQHNALWDARAIRHAVMGGK